jgi:5-methylcytosine-specific restriction protein A
MTRREFPAKVRLAAYERAGGHCEVCTAKLYPGKYRYDHRIPDALGGEPTLQNCVVQCVACDAPKTAADLTTIAKSKRIRAKHAGIKTTTRPLPGSRQSPWKRHMDGTVSRRDA